MVDICGHSGTYTCIQCIGCHGLDPFTCIDKGLPHPKLYHGTVDPWKRCQQFIEKVMEILHERLQVELKDINIDYVYWWDTPCSPVDSRLFFFVYVTLPSDVFLFTELKKRPGDQDDPDYMGYFCIGNTFYEISEISR